MKRATEEFEALEVLENNNALTDPLLDCKSFYRKETIFKEFFSKLEDVIVK